MCGMVTRDAANAKGVLMEEFKLGKPALVCRWRLANKRLPMENRHLRALGNRHVNGAPVANALVAWVKQHVEWTLEDGASEFPDGVLMLVIDDEGKAAMSVGEYRALEHLSANDLLRRAESGMREAVRTGVSPEDLWVLRGDALLWGTSPESTSSGASSLIGDLAQTLGMPVIRSEELLAECRVKGFGNDEVFLVSDEHGVVASSDHTGPRAQRFVASYAKLLSAQR